jgi:hypothetical protein
MCRSRILSRGGDGDFGKLCWWWIEGRWRSGEQDRGLKGEATAPPEATLADQQRAFDRFGHEYDDERPREVLGHKLPGSRYVPSRRGMPSQRATPGYAEEIAVRASATTAT